MTLYTERLILRPWREDDSEDLYKYASDPDVGPIAGWPVHTSVENSRNVIKNVLCVPETYAVCLKEDGRAIGSIGLKMKGSTDMTDREDECELGYWIGKPYWGQGIIPEAARELLRHAFEELGMRAVWCGYYDGNEKSKRVQEKLGFVYQHKTEGLEVALLGEIRTGHCNLMTKETWKNIRRKIIMRKNFGVKNWLYPMPVLIVGTYDENGRPNAMNAAWGGIYDTNLVMVCLADEHKTTENINKTGAFTVSFATADTVIPCDYVGIVSANDEPDKFAKAGFHATKSEFVNAPVIDELPMTVECKLHKFTEDGICIGEIVNVCADESILDEKGNIDAKKLDPIIYDSATHAYWSFGEKVGQAFSDGKNIK